MSKISRFLRVSAANRKSFAASSKFEAANEDTAIFAGALSDGLGAPASKKVSDGIKSVYQDFSKQIPELTEESAPVLYSYLNDEI